MSEHAAATPPSQPDDASPVDAAGASRATPLDPATGPLATPIASVLSGLFDAFTQAGVPDADVDAELLVGHVLGLGRGAVQAAAIAGGSLDAQQLAELEALAARRSRRPRRCG